LESFVCSDIEYSILEVSLEGVDEFHKIVNESVTVTDDTVQRVFIHLGVSGIATCFHLEEYAYNNKNFRVPDENGNQPINCNITASDTNIDTSLRTALPLASMKQELDALGHETFISDDPGRFLCNYVHYQSLSLCNGLRCTHVQITNPDPNPSTSLFVHVPSVDVIPLEKQVEFVKDLLKLIK